MHRLLKAAAGLGVALVGAWTAWGVYATRTVERIPYETLDTVDGVEIRRYPRTVLVETTAPDERTAFRRLFQYIDGENDGGESVEMTAPVESDVEGSRMEGGGESIEMTAPVRTESDGSGTRMAFYLPDDYDPDDAPVPTDPAVRLVVEPPRTVAAYDFSWFATDGRVERARDRLRSSLAEAGVEVTGDPSLLRYDDPRMPPFLRTNEVVVEVDVD